MTNEEILTKAIEKGRKALDNEYGWIHYKIVMDGVLGYDGDGRQQMYSYEEILFNHEFAKAFVKYIIEESGKSWILFEIDGEGHDECQKGILKQVGKERLYQIGKEFFMSTLVSSEDRLKYISQFL